MSESRHPGQTKLPIEAPAQAEADANLDPLNQAPGLKTGPHTCRTANGYELMEVVSTLQKEVRRGNEKAALFWACELQESTSPNNACGYAKYMWKRLTVMASEDIGLVNPMAALLVDALCRGYERLSDNYKKSPSSAVECLAHAVILLCRSPKNREVDDALLFMISERARGNYLPIPDYALDHHTTRGKRMGRTDYEFFFTEAGKIENVEGPNHYAQFVGDKVNRSRYSGEAEPPLARWNPVHVPAKTSGKDHRCAATAERIEKATRQEKGRP